MSSLTLRLESRPNPLHGEGACSIIVEGPGFNPIRWRSYSSAVSCRAAAKKLTSKPPRDYGTIAEQMGGATIKDLIEETTHG